MSVELTYDELRESKKSKYDLEMKNFLWDKRSILKTLLDLDGGADLVTELPGLDGRSVDSLVGFSDAIVHTEFQTKSDDLMCMRMLEYYISILKITTENGRGGREIIQSVIHVGSGPNKMAYLLKRDAISYSYSMRSITDYYDKCRQLHDPTHPIDRILLVVCKPTIDHNEWVDTAKFLAKYTRENRRDSANLKAYLLIASLLKKVPIKTVREIEKMLQVNVEDSDVLKQAVDDVAELVETQIYLDLFTEQVTATGVDVGEDFEANLKNIPVSEVRNMFVEFFHAGNKAEWVVDLVQSERLAPAKFRM
ncbi:hypothetical protein [Pleomorphomonas koreensis]|uniref:hypothetical protein n=1 Tax=Pleomorphomonas koreensis TaxID=257440 RepID=UPI0012EC6FBA|nr:hypothetical protein [Pleomorphomonas koreensis]